MLIFYLYRLEIYCNFGYIIINMTMKDNAMDINLEKFCEYFYGSHYIPIALYKDGNRITYYSSLHESVDFSFQILPFIEASVRNPDVFTLSEQGQYGLIRTNQNSEHILIGPVFSSKVTEETILAIARKNYIDTKKLSMFSSFLTSIPNYTYNQFLNMVAYLHYCLNHESFDIIEHFHTGRIAYESSIDITHSEKTFAAKEQLQSHGTYQLENTLLSYIRDGDVKKLNAFLLQTAKTAEVREGTLADTPLRQAKNLLIGLVTLVGKIGAIGGGMDVEETYQLIDLYIQECEKAPSVDAVKILQYNMVIDFTERVNQTKIPKGTSKEVFECMQFIQNRTSYSIGINDVAEHINKSRAYITRKFRDELNMSITEFIIQCKIRDAKRLLRYSEKTLCEISNYLCFSSQSYFQTVFKKDTSLTPNKYRQKHSVF